MDVSFKQIYMQNISPKLMEIDLFLKTNEAPYDHEEVALILGMPVQEVTRLMSEHEICQITLVDFFTILSYSSSYICRLIQRQWKYAMLDTYTPEIIASIYEININKVQAAFDALNKSYIASHDLMDLFDKIPTSVLVLGSKTK